MPVYGLLQHSNPSSLVTLHCSVLFIFYIMNIIFFTCVADSTLAARLLSEHIQHECSALSTHQHSTAQHSTFSNESSVRTHEQTHQLTLPVSCGRCIRRWMAVMQQTSRSRSSSTPGTIPLLCGKDRFWQNSWKGLRSCLRWWYSQPPRRCMLSSC